MAELRKIEEGLPTDELARHGIPPKQPDGPKLVKDQEPETLDRAAAVPEPMPLFTPQELAGGDMSPMRKTAGQKAAATRKRNAAKRQAATKKAASTRKLRTAGKKAARTRTRREAARKAAATRTRKKEAALTQPVQVQEPPASEAQVRATPETSIPE
jgi:hypothetical protein